MTDPSKKPEAPANAKKNRDDDAKKAMAEYEAQAIAIREKTERLRALRLAREAELAATAPPKRKPVAVKRTSAAGSSGSSTGGTTRRGKAEPRPKATLSEWLNQQDRSGRRT